MPSPSSKKSKKPVQDPDNFWMVQNKITKRFSNGGTSPWFGLNGKIWRTHSSLMAHITLVSKRRSRMTDHYLRNNPSYVDSTPHPYADCQIIMYRRTVEAAVDFVGYGE